MEDWKGEEAKERPTRLGHDSNLLEQPPGNVGRAGGTAQGRSDSAQESST